MSNITFQVNENRQFLGVRPHSYWGDKDKIWCKVTSSSQAFLVQKNFQLFSAVLVEKRQSYFGDMSSFVQKLARSGCTKVTWGAPFVLRKFLDLQSTKETCHMVDIIRLCSEMLMRF